MTDSEAVVLAHELVAWGKHGRITASVRGDRIVFDGAGAQTGGHSLDIGASSRERVLAHWRGFVTTNGGKIEDPAPAPAPASAQAPKTPPAQLEREIKALLNPMTGEPLNLFGDLKDRPRIAKVRRLIVITYVGGDQHLGEFTKDDRWARVWSANKRHFFQYKTDTQPKPADEYGRHYGVKGTRPATMKDLRRFHYKLPEGHTLADSPELEAERKKLCAYCDKPTRKGSIVLDEGQTAHRSCIKEFEEK